MAALRIHHHRVDGERVALPLPPLALGPAGHVGAVAALEHQPLDRGGARPVALLPQLGDAVEGDQLGEVHARQRRAREPRLQPRAPRVEPQRAQVLPALEQQVVEPHRDREVAQHLRPGHLAVEALLQVGERGDHAVADHQQLAVEHALEVHRLDDLGERRRDVVGAARVDAPPARGGDELHPDAVPLPLRPERLRVQRRQVRGLQRLRQHRRPEHRRVRWVRPRPPPLAPGEQRVVWRRQAVPYLLDLVCRDRDAVPERQLRQRDLGQARRRADAQRAGDELEHRIPDRTVRGVEPARHHLPQLRLLAGRQRQHHLGQQRRRGVGRPLRPHQRHRLRQVAHEVVAPGEQHRVDAALGQGTDQARLGGAERKLARHRGQGVTAVGVGLLLEETPQQRDLGQTAGRQRQAV